VKLWTIFFAGMLYDEVDDMHRIRFDLPDGVYIYRRERYDNDKDRQWFLKDLTPILLDDVPQEYRTLLLLLT
jgi:hypothetical protein